ncbi:GNAT family N-acetyltransferase [Gordonia neofelifaecis]|uniref:GCN5-like N-acetyltransferase n=1 Tax=Gordonia neofelifaecis NRRL B-59395 TaxID=644548 RepID=F1YID1_9ACTN|nr:GNAT family N-acetyltransferase [Gordonia neofelifaecis]EGD55685.1 GCN5-like N-acetyltransferase [Gordonia neofelifaecis NRRL B-59395]
MLGILGDRPLGAKDADAVARALDLDPVASCMVSARVEAYGLSPRFLGGEMWTASEPGVSLAFSGANLMPLIGGLPDVDVFADRALSAPRLCSSVVGAAELVLPLWERVAPSWGPAREVRADQPLLSLSGYPEITPDSHVRLVTMADLDAYFPAAVEMFIGEVGVDPTAGDEGRSYRRRLAALISARRVFARFDGDRVVFKAEIGSMSRKVGQIQGVWVDPQWRGRGYGALGTAAVAAAIARQGRIASLYVNSFNGAARQTYQRVGFRQVGTFATVLVD